MATLSAIRPTLLDLTKRLDPNGKIDAVVELLNQSAPVLDDIPWQEGNLPTGHRTTVRTGLPAPTWRKLYGGVQPTKSTTAQVTESCGMLEAYAEVDKALADLNGNTAAFRLSEEKAHIEGMAQEFVGSLFYADETTEPEAFTGFAPSYNSSSAANGDNILNGGTTPDGSDNTSIWLVGWGDAVHGIYPKGSVGGLQVQDLGEVTIENIDGAGGRMQAYRSHYRWDCGLTVRDWRYVVRLSVNAEDLTKDAASGDDLIDMMTRAQELIPSLSNCNPVYYGNRKVLAFLRRQMVNKIKGSTLTMEQVAGKRVVAFDGIPVRRIDQLLNTEAGLASNNVV